MYVVIDTNRIVRPVNVVQYASITVEVVSTAVTVAVGVARRPAGNMLPKWLPSLLMLAELLYSSLDFNTW